MKRKYSEDDIDINNKKFMKWLLFVFTGVFAFYLFLYYKAMTA